MVTLVLYLAISNNDSFWLILLVELAFRFGKITFFLLKHSLDVTEVFQLLSRRHLFLHPNGIDSLATETGAVEQTLVMWLQTTPTT